MAGANRYKAVRLTPAVYNAANRDLSDLRITDSAGQPVPYFISSGATSEELETEAYPLQLIDAYLKDDRFYFDYRLAAEQDSDIIANSIVFTTSADDFAKEAGLYGSHDNLHWEAVAQDTIYSVGGQEDLAIEFPIAQKFTHYRLSLANNLERIAFDSAALAYSETKTEETDYMEAIRPAYTVEAAERRTLLHIEGLTNLRLCDVTIETGSMFQRMVTGPGGMREELYHLTFGGAVYADTTLELGGHIPAESPFTLAIANGDDRPIDISGVVVRYYADELIFEGSAAENPKLEVGADPAKTAPVYDIARYSEEILRGEIDRVSLGEITYAATEEPPPQRDYSTVFNVLIILVAVLLGGVFLVRLRGKG
jgi:hypothetical protein